MEYCYEEIQCQHSYMIEHKLHCSLTNQQPMILTLPDEAPLIMQPKKNVNSLFRAD